LGDEEAVVEFFEGLSQETRDRYGVSEDGESIAQDWAQSIAVHDKLRMVLHRAPVRAEPRSRLPAFGLPIAGVAEFSLHLTEADRERYARWGVPLRPGTVIRFGICLADEHQSTGIAGASMPALRDLVTRVGRRRVMLWDGVLAENGKAIAFFERNGFRFAGTWTDERGRICQDMFADV
jgi:GNAT superfamily N-acetyltransferase